MSIIEMKIVPTASISLGTRFREDIGDVSMLVESFKHEGIIQPLAVQDSGDGTFLLLAGGRRLTAAIKAEIETVPVRCYPATLSELERRSIELMENVCRKDLEWLEAAKLKKEIHLLQVEIHGEKTSTSPNAPGWSIRDTAELLGKTHPTIIQDIQLADAAAIYPDLMKAKNRSDATKMLGKLQEKLIRGELASRIEAKTAETPIERVRQNLSNQYLVGDFFEGVKTVPNSSIDFVELDPPYAIDLNAQKRDMKLGYTNNYNEIDTTKYHVFMTDVLDACYRVMSSSSWMILWHAKQWRSMLQTILESRNLEYDEGIWYKGPVGQTNSPNYHLASSFEPFLYIRKGNPSIIRQGRSNVFHYKPISGKKVHPTERPIEMIQDMIQTFCWEGTRILVPFMGSGNTALAASNLGMTAFGWDLAQEYKDTYIIKVSSGRPGGYRSYKEVTAI